MDTGSIPFWSLPLAELVQRLKTTPDGLRSEEARSRFLEHGADILTPQKRSDALKLLLAQFKSPIILILIFAAGLSFFLHDSADALIILVIVLASGLLGFWQERGAADVVEKLLTLVRITSTALRDGHPKEIPLEEIVPGDVVMLKAGDSVPGDCLLLDSKNLFLNEASLTGETYPI